MECDGESQKGLNEHEMGNEDNVERGGFVGLLKVEEENEWKDEGETRANNILLPSCSWGWPQQIALGDAIIKSGCAKLNKLA